jgi:hypothetical protein
LEKGVENIESVAGSKGGAKKSGSRKSEGVLDKVKKLA